MQRGTAWRDSSGRRRIACPFDDARRRSRHSSCRARRAFWRRRAFAVRDGLAIGTKPERGAVLGYYTTERAAAGSTSDTAPIERAPIRRSSRACDRSQGAATAPTFRGARSASASTSSSCSTRFSKTIGASRKRSPKIRTCSVARASWDPAASARWSDRSPAWTSWLDERGPIIAGAWRDLFVGGRPDAARPRAARRSQAVRDASSSTPRSRGKGRARPTVDDATPAARAVVGEELPRTPSGARAPRQPRASRYAISRASSARSIRTNAKAWSASFVRGDSSSPTTWASGRPCKAIAACHALFAAKAVRKGLVIVPASLEAAVASRMARGHGDARDLARRRAERTKEAPRRAPCTGFVLLSITSNSSATKLGCSAVAPDIVVIADEAQRIKNYATKSAEAVKRPDAEYRLVPHRDADGESTRRAWLPSSIGSTTSRWRRSGDLEPSHVEAWERGGAGRSRRREEPRRAPSAHGARRRAPRASRGAGNSCRVGPIRASRSR